MFYQMMNNFHIYSDFQRRIMKKEFLLFKNKLKPVRKGNFRILQKEKEQFFKKLLLFCVLKKPFVIQYVIVSFWTSSWGPSKLLLRSWNCDRRTSSKTRSWHRGHHRHR